MKVLQSQLVLSNHARICYTVTLTEGSYADLFKPETWAHVAAKIPKGSLIEAQPENGDWFALLLVRRSTDLMVEVAEIVKRDFTTEPVKLEIAEYEVKHRGRAKWSVIRNADKSVMVDGLDTREQAEEWVKNPLPRAA